MSSMFWKYEDDARIQISGVRTKSPDPDLQHFYRYRLQHYNNFLRKICMEA